jgi:hypothetical protein
MGRFLLTQMAAVAELEAGLIGMNSLRSASTASSPFGKMPKR